MKWNKQQDMALKGVSKWFNDKNRVSQIYRVFGYAGTGKALPLDADLQTPNGPIKMKDVKVGSLVFGKNGKETKVTGVYPQGIRPTYKMTFSDGASVICDKEHLWHVFDGYVWNTLTTIDILDEMKSKTFNIPICECVDYKHVKITNEDLYLAGCFGVEFIPSIYLRGDKSQRYKYLNGFMDTNGNVIDNKTFIFLDKITLDYRNNFINLVQSLGGLTHINDDKLIVMTPENPFSDASSMYALWKKDEDIKRYISKIEKIEDLEMQCISVDSPDELYLTDWYVVTHNTSLAKHFRESISGDVLYGAYTGKAASVMRKNGCEDAKTLHSLIYTPIVNEFTGEVTFELGGDPRIEESKLFIIDECSMVDAEMANDLLSFGKPILVLGDPAQLPPVNGEGFFTNCEPDNMLTEIHRQGLDNPIIYMANKVRNNHVLKNGLYGESVVTDKYIKNEVMSCEQVICGKNDTRREINSTIRKIHGRQGDMPEIGEILICTKNKSSKKGGRQFYNGGMYEVEGIKDIGPKSDSFTLTLLSKDDYVSRKSKVFKYNFSDSYSEPTNWKVKKDGLEVDYGYCITAHKSQGSQWESVYIVDESKVFRDFSNRWLYTAITRASERIVVLKT